MEGAAYPKALYKDGGADLIWGVPVRTLIVDNAEQEGGALERGWRLHPVADPADPIIKRGPGRPRKVNDGA